MIDAIEQFVCGLTIHRWTEWMRCRDGIYVRYCAECEKEQTRREYRRMK